MLWLSHDMSDGDEITHYYKKLWKIESNNRLSYDDDSHATDTSVAHKLIKNYGTFQQTYPLHDATDNLSNHWSTLNDNPYTRRFDSSLARSLVENPLPEMYKAAKMMGDQFLVDLHHGISLFTEDEMLNFLHELRDSLQEDTRGWFNRTQYMNELSQNPSHARLKSALTSITNGFEIIAIPYLIIKTANALRHANKRATPKWHQVASKAYDKNVVDLRSTGDALATPPTHGYGIRLPRHPPYEEVSSLGMSSINWTTAKPLRGSLRAFAKKAMHAGHPVVSGLSGSAYLLSIFMHHIGQHDRKFDKNAAMLCVLAFATFDGGHSINEAMSSFQASATLPPGRLSMDPNADMWREWRANAVSYKFRYSQLKTLAHSKRSKKAIGSMLNTSLDNTIDFFRTYDRLQRENDAVLRYATYTRRRSPLDRCQIS
jgi:hypothetical protein